jgi:transketolase
MDRENTNEGMMAYNKQLLQELEYYANRIRQESILMTYHAKSGHPGGSLSEADILAALYFHKLRIDPGNPHWEDRDRFILSKGHACPGLYATLALRGFFPLEALVTFRQADSILQGHPDMKKTPGVEMVAGPLGNGLAAGIGMALGSKITGKNFQVYVLIGDGDAQEGCTWEAAMFAGFHEISNLVCIFDYNRSQVDGPTKEILCLEPIAEKWRSFNWDLLEIDGHNMVQILEALDWATSPRSKPAPILAHTIKGKGVSFMEDQAVWHGKAPNKDQANQALQELSGELIA